MSPAPATYRIELPQFEGPFDLLLFFIERDEIDIGNIPIAKITDDFLAYVRGARTVDISLAGDFIVVAATLMSIKARMLLPRLEKDAAGQDVDPRQELVDRLLEYRRYKAILSELREMEEARGQQFGRPFVAEQFAEIIGEARAEAEWESVTLYKLLRAFERVLQRQKDRELRPVHRVVRWPYTVEEEGERIQQAVQRRGRVGFVTLFGACTNRVHAIVTFLALLELLNGGLVAILHDGVEANALIITHSSEVNPGFNDDDYVAEGVEEEEPVAELV